MMYTEAAPSIFRWEVNHVFSKGDYEHPKNREVKMRVFVKELQRKYSLSDEAIQHILSIVDTRQALATGRFLLSGFVGMTQPVDC